MDSISSFAHKVYGFEKKEAKLLEHDPEKFWKKATKENGKKEIVDALEAMSLMTCTPIALSIISGGVAFLEKKDLKSEAKDQLGKIKAICEVLGKKDQEDLVRTFEAQKDKQQFRVIGAMLKSWQWDSNPEQRDIIDRCKKISEVKAQAKPELHKELASIEEFDEQLLTLVTAKAAGGVIAPKGRAALHTTQVFNHETLKTVKKICEEWRKKAAHKILVSSASVAKVNEKKQDIARASFMLIDGLDEHMPKKPKEIPHKLKEYEVCYIAYDESMKFQGMALAEYSKKEKPALVLLVTNPDNTEVLGTEQNAMRGAGTAIITHMAHDILHNKAYKKTKDAIILEADVSAEPFYKKLGFKDKKHSDEMILDKDGMKHLLARKHAGHTMHDREPAGIKLKG